MEDKNLDIDEQAKKITKLMACRLAEKIKTVRKEKNITTRRLKELANVSTAIISDFETKSNYLPKMEVLVKFALALEIDIKEMLSTMLPTSETLEASKTASKMNVYDALSTAFKHLDNSDINEIIEFANTTNKIKLIESIKDKIEGCTIHTDKKNNLVATKNDKIIFKANNFDITNN